VRQIRVVPSVQDATIVDSAGTAADPVVRLLLEDSNAASEPVVLVELLQGASKQTLLVDLSYLEMARAAGMIDDELIAGLDLPRAAVLGVAPLWPSDWDSLDLARAHVEMVDSVPHLHFD
jgi:hypothetical protein